jgi:gag-polypeptide of LTR copia-type
MPNAPMSESAIEKAALAITKLEGRENWIRWSANIEMVLDHTWEYVEGSKTSSPQEDSPDFADWSNGNRAARRRIWLALSDKVQDTVFRHLKSPAATLFKALKNQYEQSGASAEFYATKTYNDAKLSDYDSVTDFLNTLMNLAHQVNKEIVDPSAHISDRAIAMRIIHSLPPCMRTLQTILIRSAPPSSKAVWDLDTLKKDIEADELRARAAGENLGTKLDLVRDPKALTMEENKSKGKKDPNDPIWLARQTCWACGKTGHLRQKCTATQEEKDAYREEKDTEGAEVNAVEPEEYALLAQISDCGGVLEVLAVQSDSF